MSAVRVAAYCRVSTDKEDQQHSLQSQERYFEQYIRAQDGWELVGIFADEGVSGTSTRRRRFGELMAAAEQGMVDLILTKEVSRFARNTVDALECTRRLKALGVGVIFISDNIDTRDNDGEFRLTIMASVAQEESRKISERVKWGQRRSMERGVVFGANTLYGYHLQKGCLTVREEQAEVVRQVYDKFLRQGKGTHVIARELDSAGISPPGSSKAWSSTMVLRLLRNEKYCGDLMQGKTCTPDFLSHKKVKSESGQILLCAHHEPIVPHADFDAVQHALAQRAPDQERKKRYSARYWCSGRVRCALCGARFVPRSAVRRDGSRYRLWVCANRAARGTAGCTIRAVGERTLYACAVHVLNMAIEQCGDVYSDVARAVCQMRGERSAQHRQGLAKRLQQAGITEQLLCHTVKSIEMEQQTLRLELLCAPQYAFSLSFAVSGRGNTYQTKILDCQECKIDKMSKIIE